MPHSYYVLQGHEAVPSTAAEWARAFETMDRRDRRVALTELPSGHVVSTVFHGLNHRFIGDGPPLLFETMVGGDGDFLDLQWQCATWAEAEAQHEDVVMRLTEEFEEMDRRFRARR